MTVVVLMLGSNFTSVALMALYTARANMAAKPSHMRKTALAKMGVLTDDEWLWCLEVCGVPMILF